MFFFSTIYNRYLAILNGLNELSGIPVLLVRLYLAPILIQAGWNKYLAFDSTVEWFGNTEWGLGLPAPVMLASLAIGAELIGGLFILVGLMTRLAAVPLMVTMLVAIFSVHWPHGWLAIADSSSWLADGTIFHNPAIIEASEKLSTANSILQEHGNFEWLTSSGRLVVLNNGIEFAATYFIMLFSILFTGGGRYFSVDYWIKIKLMQLLQARHPI